MKSGTCTSTGSADSMSRRPLSPGLPPAGGVQDLQGSRPRRRQRPAGTGPADDTEFLSPPALVKHAGLAPREKLSGAFVGRTKLTGQRRPGLRLAAWRAVSGPTARLLTCGVAARGSSIGPGAEAPRQGGDHHRGSDEV